MRFFPVRVTARKSFKNEVTVGDDVHLLFDFSYQKDAAGDVLAWMFGVCTAKSGKGGDPGWNLTFDGRCAAAQEEDVSWGEMENSF